MALEAQLYSQNLGFSQNNIMNNTNNINNNIIPTNYISSPVTNYDFQQQGFVQNTGNMGNGFEFDQGNMGFLGQQGFVSSQSPCSSSSTANGGSLSPDSLSFPQSFAALLHKQRRDLDHYLHIQGDKLRQVLQQQRRQELALVLNSFETRTMAIVKQKDEHLQKLRTKAKILEQYLKKAEQETELWQRVAKEKEQMVIELNNMVEQVKANLNMVPQQQQQQQQQILPNHEKSTEDYNDAESVCDCEPFYSKNRGDAGEERENATGFDYICRWCNGKSCCVVFLPCRHLCCCKECDALLSLCPVCHSVKQGSVEVFLC